jgi:hypothetical protein
MKIYLSTEEQTNKMTEAFTLSIYNTIMESKVSLAEKRAILLKFANELASEDNQVLIAAKNAGIAIAEANKFKLRYEPSIPVDEILSYSRNGPVKMIITCCGKDLYTVSWCGETCEIYANWDILFGLVFVYRLNMERFIRDLLHTVFVHEPIVPPWDYDDAVANSSKYQMIGFVPDKTTFLHLLVQGYNFSATSPLEECTFKSYTDERGQFKKIVKAMLKRGMRLPQIIENRYQARSSPSEKEQTQTTNARHGFAMPGAQA